HLTVPAASKTRRHEQPGVGPSPRAAQRWHGGRSDHRDRQPHRPPQSRFVSEHGWKAGGSGRGGSHGPPWAGGVSFPPPSRSRLAQRSDQGPDMSIPALAQVPVLVDDQTGTGTQTLDAELLERTSREDYQRWLGTALAAGGCVRPIRLRGTVRDIDAA